ncbi:MAG: ribosome-associated translation inhibitor RaiA [Bacteroidia bacterium]|nr:ribosome-associated translation inhibitor RaiA [Bacteroidia bacterium]
MTIDFQNTNFKADHKLLTFIEQKLEKLDHFYDKIIQAVVYLKVEKADDKDNKVLEIKLNVPSQSLFVSHKDKTFEAATDIAVEALKSQLVKYKDSLKSRSANN